MLMLVIALSFAIATVYYLVEGARNGMATKRWVTAGLILGPMALPMFYASKKMAIRKVVGYHSSSLQA